jgi:hypothetical protein
MVVFGSDRKVVMEDYKKLHNEHLHDIQYYSRDQIQARIEDKRNANRFGSKKLDGVAQNGLMWFRTWTRAGSTENVIRYFFRIKCGECLRQLRNQKGHCFV